MILSREQRLNIGSGGDIRDGYINLDIQREGGVDVVGEATKLPFPAGSFRYVLAQDILEHFWNYDDVLEEWYRVLKPTGLLIVRVPDWDALSSEDIGGEFAPELLEKAVYGGHRSEYDQHHRIYTEDILENRLRDTGFNVVITEKLTEHPVHWHLMGIASDDFIPQQLVNEARREITTEV